MSQETNRFQILITLFLLVFVLILFQVTNLDIEFQKLFFNFEYKDWIWDKNEPISKFLFYTGLKKALLIFAFIILLILVFFRKNNIVKSYKSGLIIVLISAMIIPTFVIGLKTISNTPCPRNIEYFGGDYPDIKVFDSYPKEFEQKHKIRCWPAGHASGGFALLSLFFLFKRRKNKIIALIFALSLGWIMGIYKMIIGDHFLSHTIITMLIAWLFILIINYFIQKIYRRVDEKPTKI